MTNRQVWLIALGSVLLAGAAGVACSNGGGDDGGGPDTGSDITTSPDSPIGNDGGKDSGSTGATCDASIPGTCNIVAQNCPSGNECDAIQQDGGTFALECVPNTTGNTAEGYACTASAINPCVAGLECLGGRCSKRCCDDSQCGQAHPEGFQGTCIPVTLPNSTTPAYMACSYTGGCQPFDIAPCSDGGTCVLKDSNGTATCAGLNGAGDPEKHSCTYWNDCAAGLGCFGAPDGGGFTCQYNCYVPPGPYDAGITKLPAGQGGCNSPETCKGINWGGSLPTWFGLCM